MVNKAGKKVVSVREIELAYIAGIVDGEGYICCVRHVTRKSNLVRYDVVIGIKMTTDIPLTLVQSIFGGNITNYQPKGNRKVIYKWEILNHNAQDVLLALKPYVLLKRGQLEVALRMLENHPHYEHYTAMERFMHEADALAIKELNKG